MPLLSQAAEAIVIALVSIGYGLRWERYYTAWISVVMNIIFTAVLFSSTDFPTQMYWILGAYILLGIVTLWRTLRPIFFVFGTKTFGALALTVAIAEYANLAWTQPVASKLTSLDPATAQYVSSWFLIALVVHACGYILFRSRESI